MRLTVAVAVAWFSIAAFSVAAESEAAIKHYDLNIPRQPLDTALKEFAQQTGLQVARFSDTIDGSAMVGPITGELSVEDALRSLLSPSGLTYRMVNERTIAVVTFADRPSNSEPSVPGSGPRPSLPQESNGPQAPDSGTAKRNWFERFRLAQNDQSSKRVALGAGDSRQNDSTSKPSAAQPVIDMGEQVVTGSRIRNGGNAGSPLIVISRDEMDSSGYATLQDVLKALPQNVGGGVSEDFATEPNFNLGTSVNLRGLGADSTLILVNGNRQAQAGVEGSFVDISTIPSAMVERIEVLTDGASAIYGSDAVGGVVNIILRTDYDGAETKIRVGSLGGDADETQFAQLIGNSWETGRFVAGYQYYDRDALEFADRAYTADSDKSSLGGDNFGIPLSNPGNIFSPFTFQPAFAIPAGQDGTALTPADLLPGVVNIQNLAAEAEILPWQKVQSALLSVSQQVGERFELFVEGRYGTRDVEYRSTGFPGLLFVPASNPFFVDAFGGFPFEIVAYSFLDDLGPITGKGESKSGSATAGVTMDFQKDWQVKLTGGYGSEQTDWLGNNIVNSAALSAALVDPNPATAFNPYGDGSNTNPATLDAIRASQTERATADIGTLNLIADGPLVQLPSGTVRLAIGADHRDEDLVNESGTSDTSTTRRYFDRHVTAAFAELAVPLIGARDAAQRGNRLELSLSGRYEDYSDFGTTFNPRLGVSWYPASAVKVRGSWGTSFKAPKLVNLDEESPGSSSASLATVTDPLSSSGQSIILLRSGNNADLKEETATIWTAGFDFVPSGAKGFSLSLTYYDIEYKDRVAEGGPAGRPSDIFLQEEQWGSIINRNPSPQEISEICSSPVFFGSPSDCVNTPPAAIVDFRLRNLAVLNVEGLDLNVEYTMESQFGEVGLGLNGSYISSFERAASEASSAFEIVDTVNNPVGLRVRGALSWAGAGFAANAFVNYLDSYDDDLSDPERSIDSWTTLDLRLSYRTPAGGHWTSDTEIALSAINVLDEDPPFVNSFAGYDIANTDPLGRVLSLQVVKSW